MAPEEVAIRGEPYAAGAGPGGVVGANANGRVWDDFPQSDRVRGDAVAQALEIVQRVADIGGDAHAMALAVGQRMLERIEEAPAAGDCKNHTAELAQLLLPLL